MGTRFLLQHEKGLKYLKGLVKLLLRKFWVCHFGSDVFWTFLAPSCSLNKSNLTGRAWFPRAVLMGLHS